MAVVLVSKRQRFDGSYEVTLSQDGVRFNAIVTKAAAESPEALALYQIMANNRCRLAADLERIAQEGEVY